MAPRRRPATSVTPDPDVVELLALSRWVEESGQWDQSAYALLDPDRAEGPTYCVAGRAAVRSGASVYWERTPGKWPWAYYVVATTGANRGGRGQRIDVVAREALGLTEAQADDLFYETNTARDIRQAVFDITGVDPGGPAICDQPETHHPHPQDWPVEPPAVATFCTGLVPVGLAVHG